MTFVNPRILLVEGRKPAQQSLQAQLQRKGWLLETVDTRRQALEVCASFAPHVVVLDKPSLRFDVYRLCATWYEEGGKVPVLVLLETGEKLGQDCGISAYLRYPLTSRKLLNQLKRLLPVPNGRPVQVGQAVFDVERRSVARDGQERRLTPRQARLLQLFLRYPGEVLSRAFLMSEVWETDYLGDTRTLDVHIHWVREAIEEDPRRPVYLRTVRGMGYRFEVPAATEEPEPTGSDKDPDQLPTSS